MKMRVLLCYYNECLKSFNKYCCTLKFLFYPEICWYTCDLHGTEALSILAKAQEVAKESLERIHSPISWMKSWLLCFMYWSLLTNNVLNLSQAWKLDTLKYNINFKETTEALFNTIDSSLWILRSVEVALQQPMHNPSSIPGVLLN